MTLFQIILVIVFIVSSIVGYFLIKNVPSLLHTPLMSGMNALSGITLLGALVSTAANSNEPNIVGVIFGGIAIVCAVVNICCGFGITDKILLIITSKKEKKND